MGADRPRRPFWGPLAAILDLQAVQKLDQEIKNWINRSKFSAPDKMLDHQIKSKINRQKVRSILILVVKFFLSGVGGWLEKFELISWG